MAFHVGQKVVCVDDAPVRGCIWEKGRKLAAGEFYVIRWVGMFTHAACGEHLCVRLVGMPRPNATIDGVPCPDMPFMATRFRPVVERKTDISIFTAMLNPNKEKVS